MRGPSFEGSARVLPLMNLGPGADRACRSASEQVLAYEANMEAAVLAQEEQGGGVPLPDDYRHFIPKVLSGVGRFGFLVRCRPVASVGVPC